MTIRNATPEDITTIAELIQELAAYEKLSHEVAFTEAQLKNNLFGSTPRAEVVLAEDEGRVVGFALFFHNFSTFLGKPGIYLEDLYVRPSFRRKGYGRLMLAHLAKLALERDCGRLEWSVLNWNELAINVYRALGAKPMDEWTVYRLTGDALAKLAS